MHEILTEHATGARDEEAHGAPMDSASALRRAARGCRWGLELADLEDLGPAVRARALDRGAAILHGHLLRVLDLHLLAFLDAVTLWHHRTSFGGSMRCGEGEVTALDGQRTPNHVPIRTSATHGYGKSGDFAVLAPARKQRASACP